MSDSLNNISFEKLRDMYKKMLTIRRFEERVRYLFLEGIMPGTIHQYDGQEACAVGVCAALEEGDIIASTHRPHGHALARGLTVNEVMAELFGKTTGCCHGKGGSMHLGNLKKGMLPAIAIVGGNIPVISGMALSFKMQGRDNVSVSFFGDGASNEGAFHEGINFAAVNDLPAVFVCENNLYGASTPISKTCKLNNIADRAAAYGIEGVVADGNDVIATYESASRLIKKARQGGGPSLLELKTYRRCGHSRKDAKLYMNKAEMEYWMERDPIILLETKLLENNIFTQIDLKAVLQEVDNEIESGILFAQNSPDPLPEDTYKDVFWQAQKEERIDA
jgi:acetoin:2,6-dichlorophenolindophenol oxidoreductase subunit alpha